MFSFLWRIKEPRFAPIPLSPSDEEQDEKYIGRSDQSHAWIISSLVAAAAGLVVLAAASGYFVGRRTDFCPNSNNHKDFSAAHKPEAPPRIQASQDVYSEGLLAPAGDVDSHLVWNGTFAHIEPSKANYDKAWKLLFPGHTLMGGIVQHPKLAPETSSLAVFHQLHCIQSIHDSFWRQVTAPSPGNHTRLPFHMEQCIDYLVQAVLCAADTNLEPVSPALYGPKTVIPKKCRNVDAVFDWARRWGTKMSTEEFRYVFSTHRELERLVYIPGYKSERFPNGNAPQYASPDYWTEDKGHKGGKDGR